MKIKFFNPQQLDRNLKATVHKSGKMGFTIEAATKMSLSTDKSMSIGINEEDSSDRNLYIAINSTKKSDAFSILKAGDYYYVNTKPLFENIKWNFTENAIAFDISEETINNQHIYVFKTREKERKK